MIGGGKTNALRQKPSYRHAYYNGVEWLVISFAGGKRHSVGAYRRTEADPSGLRFSYAKLYGYGRVTHGQ